MNPATGMSPFILSYAQSPRAWQFLDTYVPLDDFVPADASDTQQGSGAQLASYLGLDVIMSFVSGMLAWLSHTLIRLVTLSCFRPSMST